MAANARWPIEVYGQDLSRAIPQAIQNIGGTQVLVPSLNRQLFSGTTINGSEIIVTTNEVTVEASDTLFIINKIVAAPTTFYLPSVIARGGLPLIIFDLRGNAGDITILPGTTSSADAASAGIILPDGADAMPDTIAGLTQAILTSNGQGLGTAAFIAIQPITSLRTWIQLA